MGIYIGCVFKNEFHNRKNKEATIAYLQKTMDMIKCHYGLSHEEIWLDVDDEDDRYSIETNGLQDVKWISLCDGVWCVELSQKYSLLFYPDPDYLNIMKDLASTLGANEMWVCDDLQIWRGQFWIYNQSFSEWMTFLNKEGFTNIKEFPSLEELNEYEQKGSVFPYESVYHVVVYRPKVVF